jgi:hypothetical protein
MRSDGKFYPWKVARYPVQPLLDLFPNSTHEQLCAVAGFGNRSLVSEWKRRGIPWLSADKLAIAHGLHPAEVWPEWITDLV